MLSGSRAWPSPWHGEHEVDLRSGDLTDLASVGGETDPSGRVEDAEVLDLALRADGAHDQVGLLAPVVKHVVVDTAVDCVADDGGGVAGLLEEMPPLAAQHEQQEDAEGEHADESNRQGEPHPEAVPPRNCRVSMRRTYR